MGSPALLHVAQIGFFDDPRRRLPSELLTVWPTMVDVAEAVSLAGVRISVVQACSQTDHFERNGVHYHFLPFAEAARTRRQLAAFGELLRELAADVFHVHGLDFPRQVLALADLVPGTPIILQDHASGIPRFWRRAGLRRSTSVVAGIAFCALDQAQPFIKAGLVDAKTPLYEIAESTCRFVPGEREEARRITALEGDPAILWVGHLDANKDPLTVLEGIGNAALHLRDLKLYCCFGNAPLLRAVQRRINADPLLRGRVHLLGRVSHERVELLMRAADLFVLGSHHEGSGYSLIEALACGLPPVVTDIPSFRALTNGGHAGGLWPCGNARALSDAVQSIWARSRLELRSTARAHFERALSFPALGRKLSAMYENVVARKCDASGATPRRDLVRPVLSS
jgi:glycosyltransferase involved in cell wall biosynthesis